MNYKNQELNDQSYIGSGFNRTGPHGDTEVDDSATYEQYGYRPQELVSGSHKKVIVYCLSCKSRHPKPFRRSYERHQCPKHVAVDGIKHKWCGGCKAYRQYSLFSNNKARADGLSSFCYDCLKSSDITRKSTRSRSALRRLTDLSYYMTGAVCRKRRHCQANGIPFDLTKENLLEKYRSQHGRCFYTGVQMVFGQQVLHSMSLDRIEPTKGYTTVNTVWCTKFMNGAKNRYSTIEVMEHLNLWTRRKD